MPALAYRSTLPRPDDPELIERFASATKLGHPIVTAAKMAGIGESTARLWLSLGTQEQDASELGAAGEPGSHVAFLEAFKDAEALYVQSNLVTLHRARPANWQASAWLLERRFPDAYGRQQRLDVNVEQRSVNVNITLGPDSSEALAQLLSRRSTKLLPEAT